MSSSDLISKCLAQRPAAAAESSRIAQPGIPKPGVAAAKTTRGIVILILVRGAAGGQRAVLVLVVPAVVLGRRSLKHPLQDLHLLLHVCIQQVVNKSFLLPRRTLIQLQNEEGN